MEPTFNDYVALIYNRFEAFVQSSVEVKKIGHPYVYRNQAMSVFFMWMQFKTIYQFKTQWRWLTKHPEALSILNWASIPGLGSRYVQNTPMQINVRLMSV